MQDAIEQMPDTVNVSSNAFEFENPIPKKYTCEGANVSPPLTIEKVPEEAKTLLIIMDDPDAPGKTFLHWTAWNLPATTTTVPEDADVQGMGGAEGTTDFGRTGYGGPCPPSGTHGYFIKVFALDTRLDLDEGASLGEIESATEDHIVAWGQLMGTYTRT